jgi:hypothetical protein
MFCNQHHLNHSDNKLWAEMFQTSLISLLCYLYLLSTKFCDECRWHLSSLCCDLSSMRTWSPFSLFSCQTHPYTIYPCSHYTYLIILQRLLLLWCVCFPVAFNGWFASLPLRVFRPNLGTRFFLGGKAVIVRVFVMLDLYLIVWSVRLLSVKLLCVCVKFLKI